MKDYGFVRLFSIVATLMAFLNLAACSGAAGDTAGDDKTAPTVSVVSPVSGATDVAADTTISATFSETMNASTLTTATFTVTRSDAAVVTGTVTYDAASKTATFTVTTPLSYQFVYTARVTTGAQDDAGNGLAADYTWSFTTVVPPIKRVSDVVTSAYHGAATVVYNTAGAGMSVWESNTGSGQRLFYSSYDAMTDTWSAEAELAAQADYTSSMSPQLATNGTSFAVIYAKGTSISRNMYARIYASGAWGTEQAIDSLTTPINTWALASNGTGYLAAWSRRDGDTTTPYSVKGSIYSGGAWGSAVALEADITAGHNAYNPVIASNGTGYAVTFRLYNGSAYDQYATVYEGSAWGTPYLLEAYTASVSSGAVIASNGAGYQIAWTQSDGTATSALTRGCSGGMSTCAASWAAVTALEALGAGTSASNIRLISNGTNYAAAWTMSSSGNYDVQATTGSAATWSAASTLDGALTGFAYGPEIASNGTTTNGYALAWIQSDGAAYSIYGSVFSAAWSAAQVLEAASGQAFGAKIASNGDGYAAVWQQYDATPGTTTYDVWVNRYTGSWTGTASLESEPENTDSIRVVRKGSGYTATWGQTLADLGRGTFLSTFAASGAVATPKNLVASAHGGSIFNPKLVTNDAGATLAVWMQSHGSTQRIYANVNTGGTWGTPIVLPDNVYNYVNAASNTGFALVWDEYNSTNYSYDLYARIFDGTTWASAVMLYDDAAPYYDHYPQLVSNGTGFAVAFYRYDDGVTNRYDVFGSVFNGTTWSTAQKLDDDAVIGDAYNPVIAASGSKYAVAWEQYDGVAVYNIYASLFDGSAWSAAATVDTAAANAGSPRIASNGTGFAALWQQYNGSKYDLYSSIYSTSWGTATLVDGSTTESDYSYNANLLSNGTGYAVAWQRYSAVANYEILTNVYDGTAWLGAALIESDPDYAYTPAIATNGSRYAITWNRYDGTALVYNAMASVFSGTTWSAPSSLESSAKDITNYYTPAIASNGTGYAVVWSQYNSSDVADAMMSVYDGTAWGTAAAVDSESSGAYEPHVSGRDGRYSVIWAQPDSAGDALVRYPYAKLGFIPN